ncbi:MAG: hypothetical protein GY710_24120 [Desulfobacteraceae bacterium]|nr:hypothetical protein [Desulfobacteraceae bacterium]
MKKELRSLAVGATLIEGNFVALVLKVKLSDGSIETFAWGKEHVRLLIQALIEYSNYLQIKNISLDGDAVEAIVKKQAPPFSQEDVEKVSANFIVTNLSGHIDAKHNITLSIILNNSDAPYDLVVTPNYCEWFQGYVFSVLNEFDEEGYPILPDGLQH